MIVIGGTVGNYVVERKIGEGAMGIVFEATHPGIGKRVALKASHPQLASSEEMELDGARVSPRRVLGEMLTRHLPSDEPDVVLIRVEFRGIAEGVRRELRYDIIDRFDESTGLSAMMRTTAFPASIIAQLMARGLTKMKGAIPQERAIPPDSFIAELAARNIKISEK